MLPEALSNGVCSLVPGEDRLAFSAFLTFDREGRCIARRFAKSVIRSQMRFTYEQVMSLIGGGNRKGLPRCLEESSQVSICRNDVFRETREPSVLFSCDCG